MMSAQATNSRVESATGLSPVLQKSPIVRYASKTDGQSQIESSLLANTTQSKRSKNYSGISRINSSKQSNVHSSVRGLSRQQQEVQNIRKLLSDVNNYNKENKEDYIPSTFYSLMRGIDPDLSKGDLVDIKSVGVPENELKICKVLLPAFHAVLNEGREGVSA